MILPQAVTQTLYLKNNSLNHFILLIKTLNLKLI